MCKRWAAPTTTTTRRDRVTLHWEKQADRRRRAVPPVRQAELHSPVRFCFFLFYWRVCFIVSTIRLENTTRKEPVRMFDLISVDVVSILTRYQSDVSCSSGGVVCCPLTSRKENPNMTSPCHERTALMSFNLTSSVYCSGFSLPDFAGISKADEFKYCRNII